MRLAALALLATLLPATSVAAEGVVVETQGTPASSGITVSWHLPPGYDESELLLEVEGGPRVRLTPELDGRAPRVVVVLPVLAGTARFVVRAGRENDRRNGRREEVDVAASETFSLSGLATAGQFPVRAAATRPVPGAVMEWWAEAPGRPVEGPEPSRTGPSAPTVTAEGTRADPALPSSRPVSGLPADEDRAAPGEGPPTAPPAPQAGPRAGAFPGATTPLRN